MDKQFWKHYRIFIAIMLVLIVSVLTIFWFDLNTYEQSRPEYEAQRITQLFQKEKYAKIVKYLLIEGNYNTQESVQKIIKNDLKNAKITYEKKSGEFKNEKPVYSILNNGKEIAILKLKPVSKKSLFNPNRWIVKSLDYKFTKDNITIIALPNEEVFVNGKKLSEKEIVDDNYYLRNLDNVLRYVNLMPIVKYEVKDVYQDSEVYSPSGQFYRENSVYTYLYPSDEKVLANNKEFLEEWCKNYTKYVVNEATFGSISGAVIQSSNAYEFLRTVANTNIWLAAHTPTVFSDFSFSNMQMYADDLFSVDISYDYSFYVNDDLKKYQTNLTIYLINVDENWFIADLTV